MREKLASYTGRVSAFIPTWLRAPETRSQWAAVEVECAQVPGPRTDPSEFSQAVTFSVAEFRQHLRSGQPTDLASGGREHVGLLCQDP